MAQTIRYFNQARVTLPEGAASDWADTCGGHETIYQAIACSETQKAITDKVGGVIIISLADIVAAAIGARPVKAQKIEFRVVKRTTVEDVMDGVGAPLP